MRTGYETRRPAGYLAAVLRFFTLLLLCALLFQSGAAQYLKIKIAGTEFSQDDAGDGDEVPDADGDSGDLPPGTWRLPAADREPAGDQVIFRNGACLPFPELIATGIESPPPEC